MKGLDKRYYSIYLVAAIITGCLVFMSVSSFAIFESVGKGKTSADLALEKAQKTCTTQKGELLQINKNNPLDTKCIVGGTGK